MIINNCSVIDDYSINLLKKNLLIKKIIELKKFYYYYLKKISSYIYIKFQKRLFRKFRYNLTIEFAAASDVPKSKF